MNRADDSGGLRAAVLLTLCLAMFPGWAADSSRVAVPSNETAARDAEIRKQALSELKRQVEALQREIRSGEASRAEAADALRASEQAISAANRRLLELSEQRARTRKVLEALQQESTALKAKLQKEQVQIGRVLGEEYRGGQHDTLKLLLMGRDPDQMTRELYYLQILGRARLKVLETYRNDRDRVLALATETAANQEQLEGLAREEKAQQLELQQERRARANVLAQISNELAQQRRQLNNIRRDEARLTRLVERLARIAKSLPAPKLAPRTGSQPDERQMEPAGPAGSFAALKGKLRVPVRGELANRFGRPRQGGGTSWKGVFFRTPLGQKVQAVGIGQVVYADWLRGFGNLIIVDHGDGYMTLYGNNDALLATVGTAVRTGDTVAQAGASGGGDETGLYFELRIQGKPVDPVPWLKVPNR